MPFFRRKPPCTVPRLWVVLSSATPNVASLSQSLLSTKAYLSTEQGTHHVFSLWFWPVPLRMWLRCHYSWWFDRKFNVHKQAMSKKQSCCRKYTPNPVNHILLQCLINLFVNGILLEYPITTELFPRRKNYDFNACNENTVHLTPAKFKICAFSDVWKSQGRVKFSTWVCGRFFQRVREGRIPWSGDI